MPGLDQLKQFSEDVANLGNELTIREERGEPVIRVPFPVNISEEDDSDDFVLGMPLQNDSIDSDETTENNDFSACVNEIFENHFCNSYGGYAFLLCRLHTRQQRQHSACRLQKGR